MSWFVVGGVAIGATAGAIVGSKKGGDDVWKDALIGGAIGGTAGYAAAPAAAAEAAAPLAVAGEGGAGIMGAGGALAPAAAESLAFTGPSVGSVVAPEAAGGFGASSGMGLGQAGGFGSGATFGGSSSPFGSFGGATAPEGGGLLNAGFAPGMQAPINMAPALSPEAAESLAFTGDSVGSTFNPPAGGAPASNTGGASTESPLTKGFNSALKWVEDNPMKAGILGFGALGLSGVLNQNNNDTFGNPTYSTAGYPLSPNFRPSRVNPQQYRYRSSYAEGGEIQGDMFPQSQMDRTQFATPSQMPISHEVVSADYDSMINPYTGDIPSFAKGGDTSRNLAMIDPRAGHPAAPDTPDWVRSRGIYYDEDADTKYQDALTAAQTRMAKAAGRANVKLEAMYKPMPMGKLNLGPAVKEAEGMAGGGIASLGGYAAGGNPHLLRGPGDGMSDDIPASIADKQPARLADGEFVVPADVVSGLGNGSTEAGAKKLHKMMDNVRVARTGTKKQGKEIKAEKYIPGMAEGGRVEKGIAHFDGGGGAWTDPYLVPTSQGGFLNTGTGGLSAAEVQAMIDASKVTTPSVSTQPKQPQVNPSQYAMGGQYTPDYRMPGSTLSGGLGRWSNIAGEAERAARPASRNQEITQAYLQNLGRAPDQLGFNYWMQQPGPVSNITNAIATSPEAQTLNTTVGPSGLPTSERYFVNQLYNQYLNRDAEAEGSHWWQEQLGNTLNRDQLTSAIMNSPEAQRYERDYITNAYQQYLGRTPDQEGLQFWQNQMQGTTNQQDILRAIQGSQEAQAYAAQHAQQAQPQQQAAPVQEEKKARKGGIMALKK